MLRPWRSLETSFFSVPMVLAGSLMSLLLFLLVLQLLLLACLKATAPEVESNYCSNSPPNITVNVGAIIDLSSRIGKEQKTAMEIATQEVNRLSFSQLILNFSDSLGGQAHLLAADLANSEKVQAVIGTNLNEATLAPQINKNSKSVPIISIGPTATSSSELAPILLPYFIEVANDITLHLRCITAIVGQFGWLKVTAIYEHNNGFFSDSEILASLTYSLRLVNSEIDRHLVFPSLKSMPDPKSTIEERLRRLKSKSSNRVFLILQSSLEFAVLLFEKAEKLQMMEKGSVWIIPDGVASHLDSVEASVINSNMQGVVGCKTHFMETSETFKRFKSIFRRKFGSEYPEEEGNPYPSIFALRAYDTMWAIANALKKLSQRSGIFSSEELSENILSTNVDGLSGKISFKERKLLETPTYKIVNAVGKSYKDLADWSPVSGFSENLVRRELMMTTTTSSGDVAVLSTVNWPGGSQTVPSGWIYDEDKPLRIAVPAEVFCPQFVNVSYNERRNKTIITGFSIDVFRAVLKHLPYSLPYELVPFNGSYDQMVEQVSSKAFDAAIGDIQILDQRYAYAEFSHPYIESGIAMIVRVKPDRSKETWMFMDAFTKEMWFLTATIHLFVAFAIWFIEGEDNPELPGFGSMLWFAVTVIFFAHREPVKSNLARFVLAPWLFAILIVSASFTANLSSMMTVSHLEPSVPDMQTLQKTNAYVGCYKKSFLVHYLTNELKFKAEKIRTFDTINDFPRAFENKEIEAAFITAPNAQVFLATHCKGYIKAGPTLKLGGFGFAFQKGSGLAIDISRGVLKAIETEEVQKLEEQMLSTTNCGSSTSNIQHEQLGPQPFFGLFYICGSIAAFGLLMAIVRFVRKKVHETINLMKAKLQEERLRAILFLARSYLNKGRRSNSVPQTWAQGKAFGNNELSTNLELARFN